MVFQESSWKAWKGRKGSEGNPILSDSWVPRCSPENLRPHLHVLGHHTNLDAEIMAPKHKVFPRKELDGCWPYERSPGSKFAGCGLQGRLVTFELGWVYNPSQNCKARGMKNKAARAQDAATISFGLCGGRRQLKKRFTPIFMRGPSPPPEQVSKRFALSSCALNVPHTAIYQAQAS